MQVSFTNTASVSPNRPNLHLIWLLRSSAETASSLLSMSKLPASAGNGSKKILSLDLSAITRTSVISPTATSVGKMLSITGVL